MIRSDAQRVPPIPRTYRPRVVVKMRDTRDAPALVASLAAAPGPQGPLAVLRSRFPQATIGSNYPSVTADRLRGIMAAARETRPPQPVPNLSNFLSISCPPGVDPNEILRVARDIQDVEAAYVQSPPTPPPVVNAADDPRAASQQYLDHAPGGIDARCVWTAPGGDGRGVGFVDLERGWTLNHEDLAGAGIRLISGINTDYPGHGTAVLGEVLAQDNTRGCIGIVPSVSARVVSQWRSATTYNTGDAIISAVANMRRGDVLLLEAQTHVTDAAGTVHNDMPVEAELDTWAAIFVGVLSGIVIVEAGGNGNNDLDAYRDPGGGYILRRGHAQFRESGAIMVGAATSAAPHARAVWNAAAGSGSNYGSRIDCFAWGSNIVTTGDGWTGTSLTSYTTSFGGTSGASPMVTGSAIAMQAMRVAAGHPVYTPSALRTLLSDATINTASANPAVDKIGVMPDLCALSAHEGYRHPVGDFPVPRRDTRVA